MQFNESLKNSVIAKFKSATKQINNCKTVNIDIPADFAGAGNIRSALDKIKSAHLEFIKSEFEKAVNDAENADRKAYQNVLGFEFASNGFSFFNQGVKKDNHDVYHQVKADKEKNKNSDFSIDSIIKWGKNKKNEIYKTGAGVAKYTKDTINTLTNFNWTDVNEKAKLDSNSDKILKDNMNKLQHKKESDYKKLDGTQGIGTIRKYLTGNVLQELNQKTKLSSEDEAYMNKQLQKYREQKKKEMEQTTLATAASDIINASIALAEGAGNFAEATIDALNIMNAKVKENEIRYEMQYRGHEPYKSDKDAEKAINKLWETTMEDVEKKKVKSFFDDAYKNNELLKKVNANSDKVFQRDGMMYVFVEGLGYYVPIIATGIFTGGGSAAVVATTATTATAAFGKYTGEYWSDAKANSWEGITEAYKKGEISKEQYETYKTIRNMSDEDIRYLKNNGYISEEEYQMYKEIREIPEDWKTEENRKKGIQYGTLNAFWEGVQTATGATLALNPFTVNQLARTGINIATDALFNAADTPFRAYVDTQMNNNVTFNEAFEARGGWGAVARDAAIGATLSAIGEIDNLSQATKDGTLFIDRELEAKKILKKVNALDEIDETSSINLKKQILDDVNNGIVDIDNLRKKTPDELLDIFNNRHPNTLDGNARKLIYPGDIAEYYNDPVGFIRSRFYEVDINGNIVYNSNNNPKLLETMGKSKEAIYNYYNYLSPEDKNTFLRLLINKKGEITIDEQRFLTTYSQFLGFNLDAYERYAKIQLEDGVVDGTNRNLMSGQVQMAYRGLFFEDALTDIDGTVRRMDIDDYARKMDEYIEKQIPTVEDIIVTRNIDSLWLDGDEYLLSNLQPGTVFNDKAFLATSMDGANHYNNRKIKLEIEVPKGSKVAYIQSDVSKQMGYGMQEVVLGRNNSYEILGSYYDNNTKKTYVRARLIQSEPSLIKQINAEDVIKKNTNTTLYYRYSNNIKGKQTDLADVMAEMKKSGRLYEYEAEVRDLRFSGFYKDTIPEHGVDHVEKVLFNAMYIGPKEGLSNEEMKLLKEAAKYHDVGRANTGYEHGVQGAEDSYLYLLNGHSQSEVSIIQAAIEYHAIPDNEYDLNIIFDKYNIPLNDRESARKIALVLKDADALDRTRFPGNLDQKYLRTSTGSKYVKASYQLQELRGKEYVNSLLSSNISEYDKNTINALRKAGISDYEISFWIKNQNYRTGVWLSVNTKIMNVLGGVK